MITEQIHFRVHKDKKAAILEASKSSTSLTYWILEILLPHTNYKESAVSIEESKVVEPVKESLTPRRCMAPYCKSLETTSKLVHGATVWLCSEHYDKG